MNFAPMALVCILLVSSQPQSPTATIRGTVTSKATGERIADAEITLSPPPYSTRSNNNGVYRLSKILPGEYSLTISAPGYARMTFRGILVPQYTPLVLDAKLRDAATFSDSVVTIKITTSDLGRSQPGEKMMFYQPDSTIDYKIRIVNPEHQPKTTHGFKFVVPDTSGKR